MIYNLIQIIQRLIVKMGQIIQGINIIKANKISPKESAIKLQQLSIKSTLENGNLIVQSNDNNNHILVKKQINSAMYLKIGKSLIEWINYGYNYSCNIIKCEMKDLSFLCNTHTSMKILMEYGDKSLYQILVEDRINKNVNQSFVSQVQNYGISTPLDILNFVKFMIDVVDEQTYKNNYWVSFHTKNIIYFKQSNKFKYLYIPQIEELNQTESFYAPEKMFIAVQSSQKTTVFSMGMVLLSLYLSEDCSDCYNYQNYTFCQSIFESKIQKMEEMVIKSGLQNIIQAQQSRYHSKFDEQISQLIMMMTERQNRLSFSQLKKRYFNLLKKTSISLSNHHQTSRIQILQPLTSKQISKGHNKHGTTPNIHCFSTNQYINCKTFSQIDEISNGKLSKISRFPTSSTKTKSKILSFNPAARLRNKISKSMKQNKQNQGFDN